jgi:hypothetical protein
MKKFHIELHAFGHYANFDIHAEDSVESVEKAILDKLGKNEVKLEKDGFTRKDRKWITYEEVTDDRRPLHYETVLGTRVATRTPEIRKT